MQRQRHGLRHSKEYSHWVNIKTRCFNKNNPKYKNYGARGITMHDPWKNNFLLFYEYIIKLPNYNKKGYYSLDRIDNNKGYEPGNIQWATRLMQARNKSTTITKKQAAEAKKMLKTKTIKETAKALNINYWVIADISKGKTWKGVV